MCLSRRQISHTLSTHSMVHAESKMKKTLDNTAIASSSKIRFDNSEQEEDETENELDDVTFEELQKEEAEIENELADITFEELQKARADSSHAFHQKRNSETKFKRANKNRPMEASSKIPVSKFREVIQVPKKVVCDPRFESLCGKLDVDGFKKRYNFVYEEILPSEKAELQKLLRSSKDPELIQETKDRISWIDKQLKSDSAKRRDNQILSEHKKKEREAAKQGKRPFYLKKSEIRKQRLIEKYNSLKASGKLDSYIEKRRKRNAAKDHRFMPYRRRTNEE